MEISYVKGPTLNGGIQFKTFSDMLKYPASLVPDRDAFIVYHSDGRRESITFSEVYEESRKFAASLISLGVKSRDKVVFLLQNSVGFVTTQFGLLMIGGIPANIYLYIETTANSDLLEILQTMKPIVLILEKSFTGTTEELQNLKLACPSLKYIIVTDLYEDDGVRLSYHKLLQNGSSIESDFDVIINPHDVALMLRTSGTTGKPKYISISNESHLSVNTGGKTTINGNPLKEFSNGLFSYAAGYPLFTFIRGQTKVAMHCACQNTELQDMLNIVEKERCNYLGLSPSEVNKIVARQLHLPESVKAIGVGGAPLTKDIGKLLGQVHCVCCQYGTLEAGPIASLLVTKQSEMENNIGGYPNNNVEIKVIDEGSCTVKGGITGRILARTPVSCTVITEDDGKESLVNRDDWIDTEDVGYISDDGKVYVLGRNIDYITIGDCTEHSSEVENIFRSIGIDGVEELVVLPLPDEECYQRVGICIIRTPGATLTESQFLDICKKRNLYSTLTPKCVIFMDSFPITATGKVRRNLLLEKVINDLLQPKE